MAAYEFTEDWFSWVKPVWDELLKTRHPSRIIEIGCYEGRSTVYLIEKCAAERALEIHCIDTWQGGVEHRDSMEAVERRFDHNVKLAMAQARHPVKYVKHKDFSSRALAALLHAEVRGSFDLIYVDGSHQAPDVLADAVLAFPLLRVGGLLVFDDYLWHMEPAGQQDPLNMPKPAIDAFINIYQRKLLLLQGVPLWQIYAEKVSD